MQPYSPAELAAIAAALGRPADDPAVAAIIAAARAYVGRHAAMSEAPGDPWRSADETLAAIVRHGTAMAEAVERLGGIERRRIAEELPGVIARLGQHGAGTLDDLAVRARLFAAASAAARAGMQKAVADNRRGRGHPGFPARPALLVELGRIWCKTGRRDALPVRGDAYDGPFLNFLCACCWPLPGMKEPKTGRPLKDGLAAAYKQAAK